MRIWGNWLCARFGDLVLGGLSGVEFFLPRAVSSRALAVRFVCGQLLVVRKLFSSSPRTILALLHYTFDFATNFIPGRIDWGFVRVQTSPFVSSKTKQFLLISDGTDCWIRASFPGLKFLCYIWQSCLLSIWRETSPFFCTLPFLRFRQILPLSSCSMLYYTTTMSTWALKRSRLSTTGRLRLGAKRKGLIFADHECPVIRCHVGLSLSEKLWPIWWCLYATRMTKLVMSTGPRLRSRLLKWACCTLYSLLNLHMAAYALCDALLLSPERSIQILWHVLLHSIMFIPVPLNLLHKILIIGYLQIPGCAFSFAGIECRGWLLQNCINSIDVFSKNGSWFQGELWELIKEEFWSENFKHPRPFGPSQREISWIFKWAAW